MENKDPPNENSEVLIIIAIFLCVFTNTADITAVYNSNTNILVNLKPHAGQKFPYFNEIPPRIEVIFHWYIISC
jgi:capsular polysaccharide biosynthesis protein